MKKTNRKSDNVTKNVTTSHKVTNKKKKMPSPEEFFEAFASPIMWTIKADQLRHAGRLLQKEAERQFDLVRKSGKDLNLKELNPMVFWVSLMCMGFSIECLFKGLAITNDPSLISNGKLDRSLRVHNLRELAILNNFNLSKDESVFCEQATLATMIDGRYPIGLTKSDIKHSITLGANPFIVYEDLYTKINDEIARVNLSKRVSKSQKIKKASKPK